MLPRPVRSQRYFEHRAPIRIERPAAPQHFEDDYVPLTPATRSAGAGASGVAPEDKPAWSAGFDDDDDDQQAHLTGYERIQNTLNSYRKGNGKGKAPAIPVDDDDDDE